MAGLIPSINPPDGTGSLPVQADIAPPQFQHNLIDTQSTPISSIMTAIKGPPMTVAYYAQVIGSSQQPLSYQGDILQVYQQYRLINNLVMAVQSDFQGSQDQETTEFTITGTSITYPHFTPMKNDNFLASTLDGKMGMFVVTSVTRMSMYNQSLYSIEYQLITWVDQTLVNNLNSRVVETLYFNMELLRDNRSPFLNTDQNQNFITFKSQFASIGNRLQSQFYEKYSNTLLLPDQNGVRMYDPFHMKFYQNLFGDGQRTRMLRAMAHYRTEALSANESRTIWDLIAERSTNNYDITVNTLMPCYVSAFARYVMYGSVFYSPINFVVFPVVASVGFEAAGDVGLMMGGFPTVYNGDGEYMTPQAVTVTNIPPSSNSVPPTAPYAPPLAYPTNPWFVEYFTETSNSTISKTIVNSSNPNAVLTVPYLKPVTVDNYYVFSQNFYTALNGSVPVGCSVFEIMVLNYLAGNPLDPADIQALITDIPNWSTMQQFYYLPVLGALISAYLGDS